MMKKNVINDYFEWDVKTWSPALECWTDYLDQIPINPSYRALEIGGRRGGLSLFLSYQYSINVICSDLFDPKEISSQLHMEYGVEDFITYDIQNCMELKFEDSFFDVIIFKSVLGALGCYENQRIAMSEIYRVLKPGGALLFAENAKSTCVHNFLRKIFNSWSSKYWYYPTLSEMNSLLSSFSHVNILTSGFIATFFRNRYLKILAEKIDFLLVRIIPPIYHYVFYGKAIK